MLFTLAVCREDGVLYTCISNNNSNNSFGFFCCLRARQTTTMPASQRVCRDCCSEQGCTSVLYLLPLAVRSLLPDDDSVVKGGRCQQGAIAWMCPRQLPDGTLVAPEVCYERLLVP